MKIYDVGGSTLTSISVNRALIFAKRENTDIRLIQGIYSTIINKNSNPGRILEGYFEAKRKYEEKVSKRK